MAEMLTAIAVFIAASVTNFEEAKQNAIATAIAQRPAATATATRVLPSSTPTRVPTVIPSRTPIPTRMVATSTRSVETSVATDGTNAHLQRIKMCESGGNYSAVNPAGYYGAYQFDLQTWRSVGGTGYPHHASPAEQDMRAQMLYNSRGSSPWPVCQYR